MTGLRKRERNCALNRAQRVFMLSHYDFSLANGHTHTRAPERISTRVIVRIHVSIRVNYRNVIGKASESRASSPPVTEFAIGRPFPARANCLFHYRGIMEISSRVRVSSNDHLYSCALIHTAELVPRGRCTHPVTRNGGMCVWQTRIQCAGTLLGK